jgi:ribonuclease Z
MPRPRVRLLGTGGAANHYRHQASLLVERADRALPPILLDTGNGLDVVRQLMAADVDPLAIQDVFISHRHLDHAGGLDPLLLWRRLRVTQAGRPVTDAGLNVYTEQRVIDYFGRLCDVTGSNTPQLLGDALAWRPLVDGQPSPLSHGGRLVPFLVDHAPPDGGAMGCVVEVDGFTIAYSGDTRPSERLIAVARGADLLLHEVGGFDRDADRIHTAAHSTAGDAGRVARAAGVKVLCITHLPADSDLDALQAEAQAAFGGPVIVATDLGSIDL